MSVKLQIEIRVDRYSMASFVFYYDIMILPTKIDNFAQIYHDKKFILYIKKIK